MIGIGLGIWQSAAANLPSAAQNLLSAEAYGGLAIDFTDNAFVGGRLYGSAYVITRSYAEVLILSETAGFAVDFTDGSQVPQGLQTTYGSAYIKE